jgi:hypothetical protein
MSEVRLPADLVQLVELLALPEIPEGLEAQRPFRRVVVLEVAVARVVRVRAVLVHWVRQETIVSNGDFEF